MTAPVDILPAALRVALSAVGAALRDGVAPGRELPRALELLAALPPECASRADGAIAVAAGLHRRPPPSMLQRILGGRRTDAEQLPRTPGLEQLFLFHRDGRMREAALLGITDALPGPFLVAAVAWRLNDWAGPVRAAAALCAARSFPLTEPGIIADAAIVLLAREASWRRWGPERAVLASAFARAEVADAIFERLAAGTTGALAAVLRHALRTTMLDPHLERLAFHARQLGVRAVALAALIAGQASWVVGRRWQWIEKPAGRGRWIATFDTRPLVVERSREALIARGMQDRSAAVIRVALDGAIQFMAEIEAMRDLGRPLAGHRSACVRDRVVFIMRDGTGS